MGADGDHQLQDRAGVAAVIGDDELDRRPVVIDDRDDQGSRAGVDRESIVDLDLEVRTGEVFGFLGPNGAGKSTTIRTLLDFLHPSSGSARIFGLDSNRDSLAIRRRVGYLPADLALYPELTGREVAGHRKLAERAEDGGRLVAGGLEHAGAAAVAAEAEAAGGRLVRNAHDPEQLGQILVGDPYAIEVPWKSEEEQPKGWDPDIDDGVKVNIGPFQAAGILAKKKVV